MSHVGLSGPEIHQEWSRECNRRLVVIHYPLCQQGVILITLLSVRCYKNPGVNICRGRGSHSSDSADVVRTFEKSQGCKYTCMCFHPVSGSPWQPLINHSSPACATGVWPQTLSAALRAVILQLGGRSGLRLRARTLRSDCLPSNPSSTTSWLCDLRQIFCLSFLICNNEVIIVPTHRAN